MNVRMKVFIIYIEQNVIVSLLDFKHYCTVHIFRNMLVAFILLEKHTIKIDLRKKTKHANIMIASSLLFTCYKSMLFI